MSTGSGLALGLDQGGGDRFLGGLVGPEDELEDGVEALAFLDRGLDQGLRLLQAQGRSLVALEQSGVTEQDQARGRPELEMAEPELLVDQADRLVGRLALVGRDPDVGKRKELKNMIFVAPDRAQLILGPAALKGRDDFVLAGALIGPAERAKYCSSMSIGALASRSSSYSSMFMVRLTPVLFCSHEFAFVDVKAQGKLGFRLK